MNRFAIQDGLAQSDFDFAGHKPRNADLSLYAGSNVIWNSDTNQFDVSSGGYVINVKDPIAGAVGDGITDDTDAINAAMNYVVTAGGGTVFFPKGVYLCNGALDPGTYNSILNLPFRRDMPSRSLLLLGEVDPPHSVSQPFNLADASTITTTKTGSGTTPALLAGESATGNTGIVDYAHRNSLWLTIKNLNFVLPNNPTLYGLRLDGLGITSLENVSVNAGNSEPTHGTVGIWTPNTTNWGINDMKNVQVFGFDTGIRTYEHLRATSIQVGYCKTGIEFGPAVYPSWGNIVFMACNNGIAFSGYHTVDLMIANEHGPAPPWVVVASDINDPSNNGTGIIRHYVGAGGSGTFIPVSMVGGAGLTIIEMFANQIKLATGSGSGGSALAKITGRGTVPPGGTTGQSLKKLSNNDYDVGWG